MRFGGKIKLFILPMKRQTLGKLLTITEILITFLSKLLVIFTQFSPARITLSWVTRWCFFSLLSSIFVWYFGNTRTNIEYNYSFNSTNWYAKKIFFCSFANRHNVWQADQLSKELKFGSPQPRFRYFLLFSLTFQPRQERERRMF